MLRIIGLVILLSAGLLSAEEINVPAVPAQPQPQRVTRGFHPLKAIQRLHDRFVDVAVNLSSIGIDQPADAPVSVSFSSAAYHPACTEVQLTAMLLPDANQLIPR